MKNRITFTRVLHHVAYQENEDDEIHYGVVTKTHPEYIVLRDMDSKEVVELDTNEAIIHTACRHCRNLIGDKIEICKTCSDRCKKNLPILQFVNTPGRRKRKPANFKERKCGQCNEYYKPRNSRGSLCPSCKAIKDAKEKRSKKPRNFKDRVCLKCLETVKPRGPRAIPCPYCGGETAVKVIEFEKVEPEKEPIIDTFNDTSSRCDSCGEVFEKLDDEVMCLDCLSEVEAYNVDTDN